MLDVTNPEYVRWCGVDKAAWLEKVDKDTARYSTTKRGKRISITPVYERWSARWYREYRPPISVLHISNNNITMDSGRELEKWYPIQLIDGTIVGKKEHYQRSKHWKEFRSVCKTSLPYECACGVNVSLSLHHKTYTRIGQEKLDDVVWLCTGCHKALHFAHVHTTSSSLRQSTDNLVNNLRLIRKTPQVFGLIFEEGWWYTKRVCELYRLTDGLASSVFTAALITKSLTRDELITIVGEWHQKSFYDSLDYFRYSENNY